MSLVIVLGGFGLFDRRLASFSAHDEPMAAIVRHKASGKLFVVVGSSYVPQVRPGYKTHFRMAICSSDGVIEEI